MWKAAAERRRLLNIAMRQGWPSQPVIKQYKLKNPEISKLEKYSENIDPGYWSNWPSNKPSDVHPASWIDHERLRERAEKAGYNNKVKLEYVCRTLRRGADLGTKGSARLPSEPKKADKAPNYASAYEHGALMADALCSWVKQGLAWGPFTKEELPWDNPKISPMSVEIKPSGAARIIVDLSSPHLQNVDLTSGLPSSVNSGINIEEFPMEGVTTSDILKALVKLGKGMVEISKQDWSDAYKHIKVCESDLRLQCVEWCNRIFTELALTFGGRSSPGIYHAVSEVILVVAILEARLRRERIKKQLDDVVAISSKDEVQRFYWQYRDLCEYLGVRLAPEDDPSKCFACSKAGSILGLEYDLETWTWTLSLKKAMKILADCREIMENGRVKLQTLKSLIGRIEFYKVLIPGGSWERGFLLSEAGDSGNLQKMINCSANTLSQVQFWARTIKLSLEHPSGIPDPYNYVPIRTIDIYTDAAGSSETDYGLGLGGLASLDGETWYTYVQHSEIIQKGGKTEGNAVPGRKLSFLEAAAVLATVSAMADRLRGQHITVWTDNIGVVWAFTKQHSRDLYCYTVMKALVDICRYLNIRLEVRKTPRCSGEAEILADMLSKGKCMEALSQMKDPPRLVMPPRTFFKFMRKPHPTRVLGKAMLMEMGKDMQILPMEPELSHELESLLHKPTRVDGWKWKKVN